MTVVRQLRIVLGLTVCVVLAGCYARIGSSWEHARQTVVDPINATFHHGLPRAIKQRDLDAILGAYDTEVGTGLQWASAAPIDGDFDEEVLRWHGPPGTETIRSRYQHILDLFQSVDSAELRIVRVDWEHPDHDGYPATVHLIVRGESGSVRRQLVLRITEGQRGYVE